MTGGTSRSNNGAWLANPPHSGIPFYICRRYQKQCRSDNVPCRGGLREIRELGSRHQTIRCCSKSETHIHYSSPHMIPVHIYAKFTFRFRFRSLALHSLHLRSTELHFSQIACVLLSPCTPALPPYPPSLTLMTSALHVIILIVL